MDNLERFKILGPRRRGTREQRTLTLPGEALAGGEWHVTAITGAEPGPALFVNAGVHGAEYPSVQAAIELSREIDPAALRGTLVILPVLNVPGFWERSMFVCPIDGKNPNRQFPGRPDGSYSEQLVWALTTEFIDQADAHIDLHGGDMVEALVPFSIYQRADSDASTRARELATVFGLPYLLGIDRPVQQAAGTTSCAAAVQRGIPSFVAEAGGVGQLERPSVELLKDGVRRVLAHLGMLADGPAPAPEPTLLSAFEWVYTSVGGLFYSAVKVGDEVTQGQTVGAIGSLTGEQLAEIAAPVTGRVLFLTTSPPVKANGLLMGIGVA
jgi:predicted deacylase